MSNEVPNDVGWQTFDFGLRLLQTALSKMPVTLIVCFPNGIDAYRFAHGDQGHFRWVSAYGVTCPSNLLIDKAQVVRD
jgi:hypothetical protein